MASATFDGVDLYSIEILRMEQLGTTTLYKFETTIRCQTDTFANYTTLTAMAGTVTKTLMYSGKYAVYCNGGSSGNLVIGENTYTNCYIEDISAAEAVDSDLGVWRFTVSFVKDTSA